jgi:asparagine synthase (glutamine-hydrolysing)
VTDFTALAYRALWELDGRSGLKALRTPVGTVVSPAATVDWNAWMDRLPDDHRLRALRYKPTNELIHDPPPAWHEDPLSGRCWPDHQHWTQAMKAGVGDLRATWEANRFGVVSQWIDRRADAADAFAAWVADWRKQNPFRGGINWASGQELAVRALAWMAGAAAFGDHMSPKAWTDLVELLYWHGLQIESEAGLARFAVANNHALAEALGLAALGDVFGQDFEEARRWRHRGLEWFSAEVERQFLPDGGYCQHSHAYHHYALELVLEAQRWFPELHGVLQEPLARSQRLLSVICEPDGSAPNHGPNDRAVPTDFAVLLQRLANHTGTDCAVGEGSESFPTAGLHVMRAGAWTTTLRCGPLARRAGHDDALHVEVWHGGRPVAIDAGSYLYSGPDHSWFSGAESHNVCTADGREPRPLRAPFTRADGVDPDLLEFDPRRGHIVASYDAYAPLRWERRLHSTTERTQIVDRIGAPAGDELHTLTQHWLLDCDANGLQVEPDGSSWRITIHERDVVLVLDAGSVHADVVVKPVRQSRVYGSCEPATSVLLTCRARRARLCASFYAD